MKTIKTNVRPLYKIANEISKDWKATSKTGEVYIGAAPYLDVMFCLDKMTDNIGCYSGYSIVSHFLSKATTWKGETARRIKRELNVMLK